MKNEGHKDKFGGPKGGWPSFGPDGKRIREDVEEKEKPNARRRSHRA